jgi:aldehyde dehydrogenase (NAD+)
MVPNAPFGGVGDSGHGAYHGEYGFKSFTHYRTIARPTPFFFKMSEWMRPPYSVDNIKKLAVRNSVGIQRNWSLEQEREAIKRGLLLTKSLRSARFLVYLVVFLGLADVGLDRRLGVLKSVRDLLVEVRSLF